MSVEQRVQARLFELQDRQYRAFHCRLIPHVNPETVIGVRTPITVSGLTWGISLQ